MHRAGHLTHLLYETEGDMVSAFASVTKSVTQARVRPLAVRHPLEAAGSLAALLGLVRTQSIDVIFTSQLGYVSLLAVTASLKGVPSVVHLGLALSFGSPLYRWSQPRIAAAVAPSQHTLEACQRLGWPVARLQVIPNGVDLEQFHPSDSGAGVRTRLGVPDGFPLVAYVGRLVEEKGIFTLVRAAAELKRRGVAFHLAMVGLAPGNERKRLSDMAADSGLGAPFFSLHDATDRPEAILAAAEAAVVPSQWEEPFGLAAIESMACGAVPIVSDAGILPDIIGAENARCVFPQGDFAALADRIMFVLADAEARRSIRASCLDRVRARFDLTRCGAAYEATFARVSRRP